MLKNGAFSAQQNTLIVPGIDAVRQTKGVAEAAICYTGDLSASNGGGKYNLDYYLRLAEVNYLYLFIPRLTTFNQPR